MVSWEKRVEEVFILTKMVGEDTDHGNKNPIIFLNPTDPGSDPLSPAAKLCKQTQYFKI